MIRRFAKFLVVGGGGFIIDFATMWALLNFGALAAMPARLIGFAAALAFTYALNRRFTFADRSSRGAATAAAYVAVSVVAAIINLGCFALALQLLQPWPLAPYLAMPIGVAAGLVVNFAAYNFLVFRHSNSGEAGRS